MRESRGGSLWLGCPPVFCVTFDEMDTALAARSVRPMMCGLGEDVNAFRFRPLWMKSLELSRVNGQIALLESKGSQCFVLASKFRRTSVS